MLSNINENTKILDDKYIILEKKGHGATANVYKIKDKNTNNIYAAKVLKNNCEFFEKETQMLKLIKSPYIVNLIDCGNGKILKNNKLSEDKQYIVLDYAEKGELFDYISLPKKGLGEKYGKVVFTKILKGVLSCHKAGICHRDLKMENILLDKNFNPKIADFGFATLIQGKEGNGLLRSPLGTLSYAAPEILLHRSYNGMKADVFSLGVVLLTSVTGKIGFLEATKRDKYYKNIMKKDYERYWELVNKQIPQTSQEFKNLYQNMISYDSNKRPLIQEIIDKDPWLDEIRKLNNEQLKDLENEIYNEFLNREKIVVKELSETMNTEEKEDSYEASRGVGEIEYFPNDLDLKYAKTGINMKNFVKIDGEITPYKFMNTLVNKIKEKFECHVNTDTNKYKFTIEFINKEEENEEKEDEDEDNDDEEEGVKKIDSVIEVKLFQSYKNGYILRFVKKAGTMDDYYKNLDGVKNEIKKTI